MWLVVSVFVLVRERNMVMDEDQWGPCSYPLGLFLTETHQPVSHKLWSFGFLWFYFPSFPTFKGPTNFLYPDSASHLDKFKIQRQSPYHQGQPISHKGTIHPWECDSQFAQGPHVCRKEVIGALLLISLKISQSCAHVYKTTNALEIEQLHLGCRTAFLLGKLVNLSYRMLWG